jgi:BON domain-containing protein
MSEQRTQTTTEFEPEEIEDELEAELEETTSIIGGGDVVDSEDGLTGEERYEGYLEAGVDPTGNSVETLTANEVRAGETIDPNLAAEEGLAWIPPSDPVVVPDSSPEGLRVAAGFGTTAFDEPYDLDHHGELLPAEDEMTDRVREALRADASTSAYADAVKIDTEGGVVSIRGVVDDILDTDNIVAVASEVTGIVEVRDQLRVRAV